MDWKTAHQAREYLDKINTLAHDLQQRIQTLTCIVRIDLLMEHPTYRHARKRRKKPSQKKTI